MIGPGAAHPGAGLAFFPASPAGQSQDGVIRDGGVITFVGVGALAATATKIITAAAVAFAGAGTLSPTPTRIKPASAVVAGVGTLAATPSVIRSGTAVFAGRGTLSATPVKLGGTVIPGRPPALHLRVPDDRLAAASVTIRGHFYADPVARIRVAAKAPPLAVVRGRATPANTSRIASPLPLRMDVAARGRAQPPEVGAEDEDLLLLAALLLHD